MNTIARSLRIVVIVSFVAGCQSSPATNEGGISAPPLPDAAMPDSGAPTIDAAVDAAIDAAIVQDAMVMQDATVAPPDANLPEQRPDLFDGPVRLSEAGLYSDIAMGVLAEGVRAYQPIGQLWSDSAAKQRWLLLPEGQPIDTSNMDDWLYPVGTKAFKEFAHDGVRIETRLMWKRGAGDWQMVAYLWNTEQTEAYAAPLGQIDAAGTQHDVPDAVLCHDCHDGRADRLLGPTAIQLSHQGEGLTMAQLIAENRLSAPPAAPLALPGDAETQQALAYLHANCGHCHNPQRTRAELDISVYFWQRADSLATLQDTVTYHSLVTDKGSPLWINALPDRMADRGTPKQMPPVATERVDDQGLALIDAFMDRLRQDVPPLPPPTTGTGTCEGTEAIFDLFTNAGCRSSFCHGSAQGNLAFNTPQELHTALVGVDAMGDACLDVGLKRVDPGNPEHSLLMVKLRPGPPCGKVMSPLMTLPAEQLQMVSDWIAGCTVQP